VTQQAVHGALTLALGGDREQADRLVDDQDGAVLVDQSQRRRKGGRRRRAQYHAVVGRDGDVAATDDDAVHGDPPAFQPLLEPTAGRVRVEVAETITERGRARRSAVGSGRRAQDGQPLDRLAELLGADRLHEIVVKPERQHVGLPIFVVVGGDRDGGNVAAALGL